MMASGDMQQPEDFMLDGLTDELRSAIENGIHPIPAVGKVLNSTALFAVLIALDKQGWSRWRPASPDDQRTCYREPESPPTCALATSHD